MTLEFLNPSRSFDKVRNAIHFIGHDGMFEVRFLGAIQHRYRKFHALFATALKAWKV